MSVSHRTDKKQQAGELFQISKEVGSPAFFSVFVFTAYLAFSMKWTIRQLRRGPALFLGYHTVPILHLLRSMSDECP